MQQVGSKISVVLGAACAAALMMAVPSAQAAITQSSITAPKDVSYLVYQNDTPNSIPVSGTSSGTTGDHVDLVCTYGSGSWKMATNVAVNADGTFAYPTVPLKDPPFVPCRMHAVPSGTSPGSLAPYPGPRLLVGWNEVTTVSSGPNVGELSDYYAYFQQLQGGFDFDSLSGCAVCDGYLTDSSFNRGPVTFYSNAALYNTTGPGSTRSEVQVDGVSAYMPNGAYEINPSGSGLPALKYSYKQNKKTGNAVITETDPLVKCPDATYPPTNVSCSSWQPTGVTAYVTMTQDHNGRICWFSAVFKSTDGKSHKLDLLWDNQQRFHGNTGDAALVETKFPGQAYATHVVGDAIPLPGKPGTAFYRVQGASDGDLTTGQGAMVYDRKATSAQFTAIGKDDEEFVLHQTATVTKKASTRFRFAYVQAYLKADVTKMAAFATKVFRGSKVPNVAGKTLAAAKKAITRAGCTVGTISYVHSSKVAAGHVVSEKPKAKSHVDYGTRIALVVSK